MHLRKTKTNNGRIYLAIVDSFYDKQKKMSRSKTIESLGYLDVLEKEYDDPITHFQKRIERLKKEKQVVFWSEKYAKRAKADREAALTKARDLAKNPGNYTRATSYGAAKYIKKLDYDKETGEILTATSVLDIDKDKIREEEALDGYYMLLTSEMETSDDKIIDMYRGLWRIEESFKITKSELEARPVYVWTREHIEAHFLTCFIALTIARILENKLERKYSIGTILASLSKAECSLIQQNYYLFDYYDEVLKDIGKNMDIDFGKRIRTLGEIKKILAKTKKAEKHHENLTNQKTRQAL